MNNYAASQSTISRIRDGKVSLVGTLAALSFLLALFPYIAPGQLRLPTEVQPWAPIVAWFAFFVYFTLARGTLTRFHLIILSFSVLFLVYLPVDGSLDLSQYIRKSASYLLCWSLIVMTRLLSPSLILSQIKFASMIWLCFALFSLALPDQYSQVVRLFVPDALGSYGERGETSLAPEATDFGFTMVYFGLFAFIASVQDRNSGGKGAPLWLWLVIALNIILSRSASGVFASAALCMIVLLWPKPFFSTIRFSGGVVFLTSLFLFVLMLTAVILSTETGSTGIRGIDLLMSAIIDPRSLIDTTLSYRLAHNLVGVMGLIDSWFLGWGAGTFLVSGIEVYTKYEIGAFLGLQGWYAENVPATLSSNALAILPVLLFEYGIFGLLIVVAIAIQVLRSKHAYKYLVGVLLFLSWAQSFPVAYPLFWLLLGLLDWPERGSGKSTSQSRDLESTVTRAPGHPGNYMNRPLFTPADSVRHPHLSSPRDGSQG